MGGEVRGVRVLHRIANWVVELFPIKKFQIPLDSVVKLQRTDIIGVNVR